MKTKKQISLNNSIRQLNTMQEEYMSNKSLDLDSRINVVKYLEQVKNNITGFVVIFCNRHINHWKPISTYTVFPYNILSHISI